MGETFLSIVTYYILSSACQGHSTVQEKLKVKYVAEGIILHPVKMTKLNETSRNKLYLAKYENFLKVLTKWAIPDSTQTMSC